ncbi:Yip1 family protein [Streptomyces montanisoli]|uniref:YIP1 family protein n=1 Tax=Streptomyces montanisoli TaxID=2798581 RepID=A0A940M819_9ACTN|nr:Yip1 family protein [Streptomyces montanisoli]MBP0456002.1 YIP1 family protein [Streptomyces montanisoli]
MAGFRNGRGRDNRDPRQQPRARRQQPPRPYAGPQAAQWPPAGAGGGQYSGEPEYFGEPRPQPYQDDPYRQQGPYQQAPYAPQDPYGPGDPYAPHSQPQNGGPMQGGPMQGGGGPMQGGIPSADPNPHANNPGHTQVFRVSDDPYGDGATYRAGAAPVPSGPRLAWRDLLTGIVMRPSQTFLQMRDYPVWGPAIIVTLIYGMLALFGFDDARHDVISSAFSMALPYVLFTGVAFVIGSLILGAVTHTVARQLGGDGSWQPTVGLSMLIMSVTDVPRLVFAAFLGGDNGFVQILGWLTWLLAGALMTSMVRKSHDLPWPKALGASAIELLALLSLLKLGTF